MKRIDALLKNEILVLLLTAFFVYFAGVWNQAIPSPDGAHRASMARELLQRDLWFPIFYQGETLADHPPLYIWLIALFFKVFGVGDVQFIAVNRILTVATVILTYFAAKTIFLKKSQASFAAILLLLTVGFYRGSIGGNLEPLLNIWLGTAFLSWCAFKKDGNTKWIYACSASIVLVFFTKGPIALWPMLFFGYLVGRNHVLPYAIPIFAFYIMVAVSLQTEVVGAFLKRYLSEQVLQSAVMGREESNPYDPFFYFRVMFKQFWPGLPLLILSVRSLKRKKWPRGRSFEALILGIGFIAAFSLVHFKLDYYIQPAFPFLAIFIASETFRYVEKHWRRWKSMLLLLSAGWFSFTLLTGINLYKIKTPELEWFGSTLKTKPGIPVVLSRTKSDDNKLQKNIHWYLGMRAVRVPHYFNFEPAIQSDAWVITNREDFKKCPFNWCYHSKVISENGDTLLLYRSYKR